MTKPKCADYLRGAGLNKVYVRRDHRMPLHPEDTILPESPRIPSVEELRQ